MTAPIDDLRCAPLGDRALVVEFHRAPKGELADRVRAAAEHLLARPIPGVTDVVYAHGSVTVHFDPIVVAGQQRASQPMQLMQEAVLAALARAPRLPRQTSRDVEIPVCYGGAHGQDLDEVARRCELSTDEVIALHGRPVYTVDMLGFMPGFAYLNGLDPRIAVPRRDTPRKRIPAGSVGISSSQTAVYPFETPGGWNLLGRTPLSMFRLHDEPPNLIRMGDRVRFVAITPAQFDTLKARGR